MHLSELTLKSFRSFDEAEILLQSDLTVFAGENNGGKSNAIDAIRLLTTPITGRREIYCEQNDVRKGSADQVFELQGKFSNLSAAQQGRFITAAADPTLETAIFGLKFDASRTMMNARPGLWSGKLGNTPEPGCHEMIRHVYLPPLRDARRALASGNPSRIMALLSHFLDGASPQEIAADLSRKSQHTILTKVDDAIALGLSALTAGSRHQVAALGFSSDELLVDIARDLRFKLADQGVSPEDLRYSGHGYANLLYMATIAVELEKIQTADLTLFLVEEPEAHLHPQLQAAVLCYLQEQAEKSAKPKSDPNGPAGQLQVVVATHSPNLSAWVPNQKLVIFKEVEPAPTPSSDKLEPLLPETSSVTQAANISVGVTPVPPPASRRVSRCIPLCALDVDEISRRKVDRYLDVTKASLLFGGRVLLVEGIAEALLLPVIAKKYVLAESPEQLRIFRSAVFVPIDGVDFDPYLKLLLTEHQGIRISDRVVVLTDGDRAKKTNDTEDDEQDDEEVADDATSTEQAHPKPSPGERRKSKYERRAAALGASSLCEIVINDYSLESELVRAGNGPLLREIYIANHPKSGKKWDEAVALDGIDQATAIQLLFKTARKGDFAQALAKRIEDGGDFKVPGYLRQAIETLVK